MYLKEWTKKWILVTISTFLIIIVCFFYMIVNDANREEPETAVVINQIRLTINNLLVYIEQHFNELEQSAEIQHVLQAMSIDKKVDVLVVQLDGKVLYNSSGEEIPDYINNKLDLHYDLYTAKREPNLFKISFPVVHPETNNQVGNAIFTFDWDVLFVKEEQSPFNLVILCMIGCLSIMLLSLLFLIFYKVKKSILVPLDHLKNSAEEIVKGNYDKKSDFHTLDEIGNLYAVFEQMRIEILTLDQQRNEQEQNYKKLVSNISHDIKTPLTTIRAYLDAVADGIYNDSETFKTYVQTMQANTEKMSRLLNDLFAHSLNELGHIPVNLKEQYSSKILTKIIEPLNHYVQTKGVQFIAPTHIPNVLVKVDEYRLEQVISNLISNALKYTSFEDSITVSIKVDEQMLKIEVIDTGQGMLPQDMPFIFERYFRGSQQMERPLTENDGAGLGLSICKQIMEAHNGSISFKSRQNEGTTFTLSLPIS